MSIISSDILHIASKTDLRFLKNKKILNKYNIVIFENYTKNSLLKSYLIIIKIIHLHLNNLIY